MTDEQRARELLGRLSVPLTLNVDADVQTVAAALRQSRRDALEALRGKVEAQIEEHRASSVKGPRSIGRANKNMIRADEARRVLSWIDELLEAKGTRSDG